ncbi:hypothetical protein PF005_g28254 [Phytophthora fragariae]|uniref:Uncharacterized protein n=1 Tax=Phytophthora fragariae TaxID=53985 RepID=A0A6A3HG78_9STRA|nr:hypothetical protein PF009_g28809 [Phytophthora fragariae]KAE8968207.1 hypothetical protein PF011_g27265 [Phytophthora fragariae]KAE9077728.1 hypothetical protein PF006_g27866 [Phytophthora fragariae]KAE9168735.1 hypothetical protein PF005_g28254 [Phytophthora fragariae]KAE9175151.1 hypothetical protein PF002_g28862 [Phytophthora fragariae]
MVLVKRLGQMNSSGGGNFWTKSSSRSCKKRLLLLLLVMITWRSCGLYGWNFGAFEQVADSTKQDYS